MLVIEALYPPRSRSLTITDISTMIAWRFAAEVREAAYALSMVTTSAA